MGASPSRDSHNSESYELLAQSVLPTVYTTDLPSGEMMGPPTFLRLSHFSKDTEAAFCPKIKAVQRSNAIVIVALINRVCVCAKIADLFNQFLTCTLLINKSIMHKQYNVLDAN